MTKRGKSLNALIAALSGSFYGATLSFILMMIMVPIFLYLVNFVGSGERALFALWALVIITGGALTREDTIRGLASMAVGLFLGTVGMQKNTGAIRFVMDYTALWDGFDLLWIILGIFAIPQLVKLPYIKVERQERISINPVSFFRDCFVMMRDKWKLMSKAAVLGTIIGVIPGIGAVTASWVGYSTAEKSSKEPEPFGKGNIDGIIGAESANNAAVPGTFVPLLALGIPGSAANAIILGAFIAAGIYPGPALMLNNGPVVWTILFGIGLSGVVFLIMGVPFIKMAQMMVILPNEFLIAFIGILSLLGTYLAKYSVFGALITILIGLVVMAGARFGLIASSVLLGYILGPTIEVEFIRAYQIGGFARFLQPISLALLILIVITLSWSSIQNYLRQRQAGKRELTEKEKAEEEYLKQLDDESVDTGSHLGDLVFGILGVILAAYILISMLDIPFLARFWPMLVATFFLGIPSLVLIGRSFFRVKTIQQSIQNICASGTGALLTKTTLDFIVIIGGLTLCTVLIDDLGFVGASALFALIVLGFFSRKPVRTIAGTLAFTAAMWFMRVSMGFTLPTGILGL